LARVQTSISFTHVRMESMARFTFFETFRVSTKASSDDSSGRATDWSRELESEREDFSESTSERRDRRSSTARMKSW